MTSTNEKKDKWRISRFVIIKSVQPAVPSSLYDARRHVFIKMSGFVEGAMDDVMFSLKIITTNPPVLLPSPLGGSMYINHTVTELVSIEADNLVMDNDKVAYIGNTIELFMYSPMIGYDNWDLVHGMTKMLIPDTFTYDEVGEKLFKKTFECPNGRMTCSEVVECIIDFERTSGHRAHKSWFGGIDSKWVKFEGLHQMFDGVYCIEYGS